MQEAKKGSWASCWQSGSSLLGLGLVTGSRLVWSGSGLKSTWMENAHFVEVERHPLYTRVREIFLKRGERIGRDSAGF